MLSACAPAAPRPVTSRAIVFAGVARSSDAARRGPPHGRGRGNRSGFLETPHTRFVGVFLASAQTAARIRTFSHFTCWRMSKTLNFRDGFCIEPAHILAHRGARSGMIFGRSALNLRGITAKTACVAKCCTRQNVPTKSRLHGRLKNEPPTAVRLRPITPSVPPGPRYPTDWPLVPPRA